MKYYTGIGARKTPAKILSIMTDVAIKLGTQDFVLRSGGAVGADRAFEVGANKKQIFHPRDYQVGTNLFEFPDWAIKAAKRQCWEFPLERMKPYIRALIIRNMMQIMGPNGNEPSKFVVCWTPTIDPYHKDAGGTRYATRYAKEHGVPVFNINNPEHAERILKWLK